MPSQLDLQHLEKEELRSTAEIHPLSYSREKKITKLLRVIWSNRERSTLAPLTRLWEEWD